MTVINPHLKHSDAWFEWEHHQALVGHYIPRRYRSATLDTIADADPRIRAWASDPHDALYLCGPVGTGKTWASWAVVNHYFQSPPSTGGRPSFAGGLVATMLDSMMPSKVDESDVDPFEVAKQAPLLLMDDLGGHKLSEWRGERILAIVDHRYNEELPTIVTANLKPGELAEAVGAKVASRVAQDATLVVMTGRDRRA